MSITFYRDQLKNEQARAFYDAICDRILDGDWSGEYPLRFTDRNTAAQDAFDAARAIRYDRPDFFFVGKAKRALVQRDQIVLSLNVLYKPQDIEIISVLLEHRLDQLTEGTAGLPEWERERMIYDRLVRHLRYRNHSTDDMANVHDHNVVCPLYAGSGVCEGFACLLTLALRKAGIPCIRVDGVAGGGGHCWNMAWIEGSPVHLDLTWDNCFFRETSAYAYFNLTDEQISRDHQIETEGLPRCSDPTKSYHHRMGQAFSSVWDAARFLLQAFLRSRGPHSIRLDFDCDVEDAVKRIMGLTPLIFYQYQCIPRQGAVLLWRGWRD